MLSMGITESIWHFAGYLRIDEFIDKDRFEYSGNWAWNTEDIVIDAELTDLDTPFVEEAPEQDGVDYQPIVQQLAASLDADVALPEFARMAEADMPSVRAAQPERFEFTPPTPGGAAEAEVISARLIQEIQIPYRLIFTDESDSRGFSSYQSNSLVDLDIVFVDEDFEFIEVSSLESALIDHFESRMSGGSYASSKTISRSEGSDAEAIAAATPERVEDLSHVFEDDTLDWDDIALIEEVFGQSSSTPDGSDDRTQAAMPEETGPVVDQVSGAGASGDGASEPAPRPIETPAPAESGHAPSIPEPTPVFVQDQATDPAPVQPAPEPSGEALVAGPGEGTETAAAPPATVVPVPAYEPENNEPPFETAAAETPGASNEPAEPIDAEAAGQEAAVDSDPADTQDVAEARDDINGPAAADPPAQQAATDPRPADDAAVESGPVETDEDAQGDDDGTDNAAHPSDDPLETDTPAPLAAVDPEPSDSDAGADAQDDAEAEADDDDDDAGTLSQSVTIDGVDQTETESEDDTQTADGSGGEGVGDPASEEQEVQDPAPHDDGVVTQAIVDGMVVDQPDTTFHDTLLDRVDNAPGTDLDSDAAPSVSSGDNIAFNDAIIGDFNEAARTFYVGQDVVDLNIAIQINAENDADLVSRNTPGSSGGFDLTPGGETPEIDGENQLSMTQETFDIGRDAGISSWGLQVVVDYAYGDIFDIKEIHQTNEIVDKDIVSTQNITQSTGLYTGSNISGNVTSYIDLGKSYDAIFINGSFINANIVYQANVTYDRDIVSISGQSDSDHVTTDNNELVNHVTFEDRGLSDWTDPTQAATNVFDSLRTQSDPGLDAWHDLPGSADGTFQVLFVSGNYYDINSIHQTNHIIDKDIAQVNADNVNSFASGNNYSANSAQIIELQGVNDQFSSGNVYSETMLYQSQLAFTSDEDAETVLNFDTKSLVTEIVAFTAGDDAGGAGSANEETFGNITVVNTIDDIFSSVMG